ncbi:unnamed protein product [Dracunculus medinensis]|uniref:WD_REPEATS_REGION domain-containing protein n=1 Tax=Dracunculus medinensis TaxID=318479 RepID=A0A158Q4E0_DRAME|nr:unnamed protein product [Dracunculus medinensis]
MDLYHNFDANMLQLDEDDFKFSRSFKAHSSDVKSLVVSDLGLLVSGGRDSNVVITDRSDCKEIVKYATKDIQMVNAVAFYRSPTSGWVVFAGKRDGTIDLFASGNLCPVNTYSEHDLNVCKLHIDHLDCKMYSASWDNTAIIWSLENFKHSVRPSIIRLCGHTMSVWAVIPLPGTNICITGSADMTIKLWKGGNVTKTFTGHEDVVRDLIAISSTRFLSCSNDSTIRLWDISSEICLQKFQSHGGEFIYTMIKFSLKNDLFLVSGGEGGILEFWNVQADGEINHKQLLQTPVQSIWTIAFTPDGDINIGADDGNIYVFTRCSKRKANEEKQKQFDSGVAIRKEFLREQALARERNVVTIKVALDDGQPNMELKYTKGSDPVKAAEIFIQENSLPVSYLDEIVEYIKTNIPEARAFTEQQSHRPKPSERISLNGRQWDYVLDVTTDDGRQLKLPYNIDEDTNWAAQRFVFENNLPISFLSEVAALLETQVQSSLSSCKSSSFTDPLTGEGRYIPPAHSINSNGNIADPSTDKTSTLDPLTGTGAYTTGAACSSAFVPTSCLPIDRKRPRSILVPLKNFITFGFEQKSEKAIVKLREYNNTQSTYRLTDEQLHALEDLMSKSDCVFSDIHIAALTIGLLWDVDTILPILDVFRIAILNSDINKFFCLMKPEANSIRGRETLLKLMAYLVSATTDPVKILACRALANSAVHEWGRDMLTHDIINSVLTLISIIQNVKGSKNLQIAAISVIANLALILLQATESGLTELGPREDALRSIIQGIEKIEGYGHICETAQIRLLQAVVTLMWGDTTVIKLAKSRGLNVIVERIKDSIADESGKEISRDIIEMLHTV